MLYSLHVMVTVLSCHGCVPWNKTRFHNYFATLFAYRLSTVSKAPISEANTKATIIITSASLSLA